MNGLLLRPFTPRIVLALSIVLALIAVGATYSTFTNTYDEPAHLAAGLELLDLGTYSYEPHHPPLGRVAIAMGPYLDGLRSPREFIPPAADRTTDFWLRMIQATYDGRRVLYDAGYDRTLTLARLGILPFLLISLLVTYAWARSLFGEWPAVLAVLLLATVPPFLGNAGIATLDVPVAALGLASIFAFCQWLDRPRMWAALALGALTGGAIITKFSAIPFLGVSFAAIFLGRVWISPRHRSPRFSWAHLSAHLKTGSGAIAATLFVFWACYGFGVTTLADPANRPYESLEKLLGRGSVLSRFASDVVEIPFVPKFIPEIGQGIADVRYHNRIGHRSFLLGELQSHGWWYYYLVALGVRTPLPLLVVGLCGLGLLLSASAQKRDWRVAAPALGFLSILTFASIYSNINLGLRHVLILYPFLAIAAAYAVMRLVQGLKRRALALALVTLFVASQAATSFLAYPDLMAYFNGIAGAHPERILLPTDLDWGQDLKRLEAELRKRGVDRVAIAYFGSADLSKHDLTGYTGLEPHTPQTGWMAVSLWRLTRDGDLFEWLRPFEPVARVGTSINLYRLTDETAIAKLAPSVIELAPGVFMRDRKDLHGSNQGFVVFDSFVVVFDPGTVIQARQLLEEIRSRTSKPVRYVVNSQFHLDHSGGAAVFAAAGAEVVAAAAARTDFEVSHRSDFGKKVMSRPADYRGLKYSPPSRYIETTWVLDDGVQRLELIHYGHGHTSGDLVGWMPKHRILFAGDLSTDGHHDLANASFSGWIAVLDKLRALQPDKVVPGHGRLAGPQALENSQRRLIELRSQMREMVARGMAFDEIEKRTGIAVRNAVTQAELGYAGAAGIRDRSSPLITKNRVAWLVGLGVAIISLVALRSSKWRAR